MSAVHAARTKPPSEAEEVLIGPRLRAIREARGLSLADVATATGISRSFLSMVENGESDIAFGRLHRLVNYYAIRFSDLVPPPAEDVPGLVRAGSERHLYSRGEGIELHLLAPDTEREIMPLLSILAPGAETTEWEGHDGEEFMHVIEGSVEISLEGQAPGDPRKGGQPPLLRPGRPSVTQPHRSRSAALRRHLATSLSPGGTPQRRRPPE